MHPSSQLIWCFRFWVLLGFACVVARQPLPSNLAITAVSSRLSLAKTSDCEVCKTLSKPWRTWRRRLPRASWSEAQGHRPSGFSCTSRGPLLDSNKRGEVSHEKNRSEHNVSLRRVEVGSKQARQLEQRLHHRVCRAPKHVVRALIPRARH